MSLKRAYEIGEVAYGYDSRATHPFARYVDYGAQQALQGVLPSSYEIESRSYTRSSYDPDLFIQELRELCSLDAGMLDHPEFDSDLWNSLRPYTTQAFNFPTGLEPLALYDVVLPANSFAGYGYGTALRGQVHSVSTDRAVGALNGFAKYDTQIKLYSPYTAFARTQLSKLDKPKERLVFGAADHNLRIECSFAYILNGYMKHYSSCGTHYPFIYGWDLNRYAGFRHELNLRYSQSCAQHGFFDWSKWDKSLEWEEIDDAVYDIGGHFTPSYWNKIKLRFINKYYQTKTISVGSASGSATLFQLYGYGPSGSGFTHLVNNYCNHRRTSYILKRLDIDDAQMHIAQDDLLLHGFHLDRMTQERVDTLLKPWPLAKLDVMGKITMNVDACEFLSYTTPNGRMHRDTQRLYNLAVLPEREDVHDPLLSASRLRGIYNTVGDPAGFLLEAAMKLESMYNNGEAMPPLYEKRATQISPSDI